MRLPDLACSRRSRTTAVLALGTVLAITVSACGGSAKTSSPTGPEGQQTQSGRVLQAHWPLTGFDLKGKAPTHPILVVKIDNTVASRPQMGLRSADLVTEELVEGGLTRLAVFFDSKIPPLVGPVRSMRASDIGLVKPINALVVTSGAAAPTYGRLKAAGVRYAANDGGAKGFFRDNARRAPYNLMMNLPELAASVKPSAKRQPPYLSWGTEKDFQGTAPATSITARFGSGHTTEWAYAGKTYTNTNTNAAAGRDFKPDTVIVVRVGIRDAGYTDPANNFVPESITTGNGKAFIFHRGTVVRGTWSKAGPTHTFQFKTQAGPLKIPAGHTWIEILPVNAKGGSLTFK